jgi:putative ABC transport system permease protein
VVVLARVENDTLRGIVQRDVVRAFPNVSMLDISVIMQALDAILGSATAAVRFVAMFSLACGIIVLLGAVAASRHQRLRESVLLRTLGARRSQIHRIIIVEYIALGALASLTGGGLAVGASWSLSRFFFDVPFQLAAGPLSALAFGATAITVLVGVLGSRSALTRPPLAVLRELPN